MNAIRYSQGSMKRALHIYITFKVANLLLTFVFQVTLVKLLSPIDFATYALLLAALMTGERILSFGIDRTILRFVPALMRDNDLMGVRQLISWTMLVRAAALVTFVVGGLLGAQNFNSILPIRLGPDALLAFGVWFIAFTLSADLDAFAQSCLAHSSSALSAILEVVGRTAALFGLLRLRPPLTVQDIIAVCAVTSSCSVIFMVYQLRTLIKPLLITTTAGSWYRHTAFDPRQGSFFALANFSSTMSYLISSPPVIRIVASGGLDVIALAAFSFSQGLYLSLQRAFPGLLILPTLEPIVMSQIAGDISGDRNQCRAVPSVQSRVDLHHVRGCCDVYRGR